ncbi:MAG: hypothetical protein V3U70_04100 [Thermoplasmata archaeon]
MELNMRTMMLTDRPVKETGYYRCETCGEEGVRVEVYLVAGDRAPSCLQHQTVTFLRIR